MTKFSAVNSFSFVAAFTIHALIVAAFYFSILRKNETPPPVVVLDISLLGEVTHHEKNFRHENIKTEKRIKDSSQAQHFHESEAHDHVDVSKKIAPIYNPLPQIPDELRGEVFSSVAVARFYIDEAGSVARVELVQPCADPRLNKLLLKTLKSWRFPSDAAGSTQDIRVNFKVE